MRPEVEASLMFLDSFCSRNGVALQSKQVKENIYLVGSGLEAVGSVGYTTKGEVKCFFKDRGKEHWAIAEGFSDEQIMEELADEIVREVSLQELASLIVKKSNCDE
tara:strand:- start:1799 stop:2116 length:318 start_codon:yes stop_codon:yes gene_type:complete